MVAQISTVAFQGIEVLEVDVQAHTISGKPYFGVVGLPDKAVGESKERVRAALAAMGLSCPSGRLIINLAPADLLKEGSHFDLAIAVSILVDMDILPRDILSKYIILGELSLDGSVKEVCGVLPSAIYALASDKGIICPFDNAQEACWAGENFEILAPRNLLSLVNHFKGTQLLSQPEKNIQKHYKQVKYKDFADVKAQPTAKRAIEIAAAGGHNLLMVGPPGSGKSMLASRMPGILPLPSAQEVLEISMVASVSGKIKNGNLLSERPFRDPHHSCSVAAMVGGGKIIRPGEITLAHNGVLFLDELPEFPRNVLDSLRQPIETGKITVARAQEHITLPAKFQFIAAMNPCKCGYYGDRERQCSRVPKCALDYQSKISGPMLDRFDIHIEVPAVHPRDLDSLELCEPTKDILSRVVRVREMQVERYKNYGILTNSQADGECLIEVSNISDDAKSLLHLAVERMGLSMRGYNRVIRVARTIADMDSSDQVKKKHISEAIGYRSVFSKVKEVN